MTLNQLFLGTLLLTVGTAAVRAQAAPKPIKVPAGKAVLLDGKCGVDEWRGAAEFPLAKGYKVAVKRTSDSVFLCVKPPAEARLSVDLYLAPADERLYTLHVSAKLGERMLEGAQWKEWTTDWPWWEVSGWWANALRPMDFEKRVFLPQQAIEFQLERARFGGKRWRIMFDIAGRSLVFPENANTLKSETWLELNLGG
jgi:hypothetical protein